MTHRSRIVAASIAGVLALGLAACSSGDAPAQTATSTPPSSTSTSAPALKAAEILAKAKDRAKAATSGSYVGSFEEDGTTLEITYRGSADGSTAETVMKVADEGSATIVSVDGTTYVAGDKAFWASTGIPFPGEGKYLEVPADQAPSAGLHLSGLVEAFLGEINDSNLAEEIGEEQVDGVGAWVLSDKDGKDKGTIHVAKETFDILRLFGSEGGAGQVDLKDWNKTFDITAPAAGDIVKSQ